MGGYRIEFDRPQPNTSHTYAHIRTRNNTYAIIHLQTYTHAQRTKIHIYAAYRTEHRHLNRERTQNAHRTGHSTRQQRTAHREHLYNLNTPVTYQLHISYISPAHIVLIYIMNKYI